MLTLTAQFLIVATLPFSLLAMLVALWRAREKRPRLRTPWAITLAVAAVWAGSALRPYSGGLFPANVIAGWLLVGRYAFGLTLLGVLLTTTRLLGAPRSYTAVAVLLSLVAWFTAISLDRNVWGYAERSFALAGHPFSLFDLWAAVWVTAWLIPLAAAWMLTRRVRGALPHSLFRTQLDYWQLALGLFFAGGALASVQQPGQPGWQQFGILISILAAGVATVSLTHSLLPDLRFALRQLLSRLLGIVVVGLLTWAALHFARQLPWNGLTNLLLPLLAGLLALAFIAIYHLANQFARRPALAALIQGNAHAQPLTDTSGRFPQPEALAGHLLALLQTNLDTDNAWVLAAQRLSDRRLALRPLAAGAEGAAGTTAVFAADSPFLAYLHSRRAPLLQAEITAHSLFPTLAAEEKQILHAWQRVLYMPVHAGDALVGLLALGPKRSDAAYDPQDFLLLQALAAQFGPLLAQAQRLEALQQLYDQVSGQNQALRRENQQLRALADLHGQFAHLLSPALQRPLAGLYREVEQLQSRSSGVPAGETAALQRQIDRLKATLETLINLAARIQSQKPFTPRPVQLDEVARDAVRNLTRMAEARRVEVTCTSSTPPPPVLGDAALLQEAVQRLLHNAIKFNKIGGWVKVETAVSANQVSLSVTDSGVGIPSERLERIWAGFAGLEDLTDQQGPRRAGLGLALTRFIVAAHGGQVSAESHYGAGSVFTMTLPGILLD